MKKLLLLLAIFFTINASSQIQGYVYVNGIKLDTIVQKFAVFATVSNTKAFSILIDTGDGTLPKNNIITDFKGTKLKFHSIMEVMNFFKNNGFILTSKDFSAVSVVMVYYLYYEKK